MPDQNLLMRYSPQTIEGPFTDVLTQPRMRVEPISGYASPAVAAGHIGLKFLEGAAESKMQKFQEEENRRIQAYTNVLNWAQSRRADPNLTEEGRQVIDKTLSDAYAGAFLTESKGAASKHPIVNIFREIATGMTGGEMPSRGKAQDILSTWSGVESQLKDPQYTKEGLYQRTKQASDEAIAGLKSQYPNGMIPPWVLQEKILPLGTKLQKEDPERHQTWMMGLMGPSFQQQLAYQMSVEAAQENAPPPAAREGVAPTAPAAPVPYVPEALVAPAPTPTPPVSTGAPPPTREPEPDLSKMVAPPSYGGPVPFGLGAGVAEFQAAPPAPPASAPTATPPTTAETKPTSVGAQVMQWQQQVSSILKADTPVGVFSRNAFSVSMAPPVTEANVPTMGDSPSLYFKYRHTKAMQDVYGTVEDGVLASPDGTRFVPSTFDKKKGKWVNTSTGQAYTDDVQRTWTFQKQASHPQGSWTQADPQKDASGILRPTFVNAATGKTITFTGLEATDTAEANRRLQAFQNLSTWFMNHQYMNVQNHYDTLRDIDKAYGMKGLEDIRKTYIDNEKARFSQSNFSLYNIFNEGLGRIGYKDMQFQYPGAEGGGAASSGGLAEDQAQFLKANNPLALMPGGKLTQYSSMKDGLLAADSNLVNLYIGTGKKALGPNATVKDMWERYSPPSAHPKNVNWGPVVVSTLNALGAKDNGKPITLDSKLSIFSSGTSPQDIANRKILHYAIARAEGSFEALAAAEKAGQLAGIPGYQGSPAQAAAVPPPPTRQQTADREKSARQAFGLE